MKKQYLFLLIALVLILAACSTPPTEEMDRARDAVTRAENNEYARLYAPDALVQAREALARMQSESDAKRYDAAKNYAAQATDIAERAIAEGRIASERARVEAVALIDSLSGPLAETSSNLNNAKDVQAIKLDFSELSKDMETAYRTYDDARQSIQAQNFSNAIMQGETVRSILANINSQLTGGAVVASRKQ